MITTKSATTAAVLGLLAFAALNATAQSYPAKTVRNIVPMAAGSGADTIGRIVASGMTQVFGQQVVLDNRTGAAGSLGAEIAAKLPADGYTLFQASSTHATNVSLYRKLPYDLVKDFAPVTQLASSPSALVVHPSLPVKTVAELVKLTKARPGEMNYGSTVGYIITVAKANVRVGTLRFAHPYACFPFLSPKHTRASARAIARVRNWRPYNVESATVRLHRRPTGSVQL